MDVKMLTAHDQSITTNFDVIEQMWMEYPAVVLICTDDILIRLGIKNADTLIHYYIPHQSQYDFSYRLSFCLDKFKCYSEDNMSQPEKPESHLLITKEFNNSLLTVVRYMQRFGLEVSDELATEAILSYCGREIQKKDLPLCLTLKVRFTEFHFVCCISSILMFIHSNSTLKHDQLLSFDRTTLGSFIFNIKAWFLLNRFID